MRHFFLPLFALLFVQSINAQRPALVFDKEMDTKFNTITSGMNDLVSFGIKPGRVDGAGYTNYEPKLKVGKSFILISEHDGQQKMDINFTGSYYTGTTVAFATFYDKLVKKVADMLATTHTAEPEKRKEKYY